MSKLYTSYCLECGLNNTLTEDEDACNNCDSDLYVFILIKNKEK